MKKIILSIILLFFLYFVPKTAYGQNIFTYKDNIPGMTCGVAGDVTGKDKCCSINTNVQCHSHLFDTLKVVVVFNPITLPLSPFINKKIDEFVVGCERINEFVDQQSGDVACVSGNPMIGGQSTIDYHNSSCKCVDSNIAKANPNVAISEMCYKYLGSSTQANELKSCLSCSSQNGMLTGLGCIPLDLNTFITSFVLTTGIGIGGGFALLCIIYAAFMMQSSQGNPEKLKKAQEMITSCIMGLMLIIFSVFIMKIIGVNILRIPGFGG
ncbi:hypothetical protein COT02_00310 [Candidatus Roizmanbacteria bacterium CG07_land_8_20_14_0_80_34_15]|uniref:Uncharacterized protein n=1 Tax=Candidatus Roizmanbacteria bacterium CG07_land_8_20_14_0_80_34_15 TaxID=1974849 RepID=A0A2M6YVN5_9BACT|nr:MAG: hypothetical protein COT02_00310 [Candidatus Roizmanbacteria bacterium CG07_land_8_20_14_0_80_34_15]